MSPEITTIRKIRMAADAALWTPRPARRGLDIVHIEGVTCVSFLICVDRNANGSIGTGEAIALALG